MIGRLVSMLLTGLVLAARCAQDAPMVLPPPSEPALLLLGQSNALDGVGVDVARGGEARPAGWMYYRNGADTANYTSGAGMVPYLLDEALADGAVNGAFVQRAQNGVGILSILHATAGHWFFATQDATTLGLVSGYSDVVYVQGEADATTELLANAYETRLRDLVVRIHAHSPYAHVWIIELVTTDAVTYPYHATVRAAQAAVAADYDFVSLVDSSGVAVGADLVHYTHEPGGGFSVAAAGVAALWSLP